MFLKLVTIIVLICVAGISEARIHKLRIEDDVRSAFPISSFGFKEGGTLAVNLVDFFLEVTDEKGYNHKRRSVGLSLHKSEAFNPYLEHESSSMDFLTHNSECYLVFVIIWNQSLLIHDYVYLLLIYLKSMASLLLISVCIIPCSKIFGIIEMVI